MSTYWHGGAPGLQPGDIISLTPSNDPLPSWGTPSARVVSVYERAVGMTPKQVRSFMRRVEREAS